MLVDAGCFCQACGVCLLLPMSPWCPLTARCCLPQVGAAPTEVFHYQGRPYLMHLGGSLAFLDAAAWLSGHRLTR